MENKEEFKVFDLNFCGQLVSIVTDIMLPTQDAPMYFEGILIDYDEEYFYLGKNPIEITQAIPRNPRFSIIISEEEEVFKGVLDSMPPPEKDEDVN